jgi:hypothetical protein
MLYLEIAMWEYKLINSKNHILPINLTLITIIFHLINKTIPITNHQYTSQNMTKYVTILNIKKYNKNTWNYIGNFYKLNKIIIKLLYNVKIKYKNWRFKISIIGRLLIRCMRKDMDWFLMMSAEEVGSLRNNRHNFIKINMSKLTKIIINYMKNMFH